MLAQGPDPGRAKAGKTWDPKSPIFVEKFAATLLASGRIDALALERARRAQAASSERFDAVLTRLGLLTEVQLTTALAEFLDLPVSSARDFPDHAILEDLLPTPFLKSSRVVPLRVLDAGIEFATADPFNHDALNAVAFLLKRPVVRRLAVGADIDAALERLYGRGDGSDTRKQPISQSGNDVDADRDVRRLEDMASEAPVIKMVQELIVRAVDANASDIHFEPGEDSLRIRYRIDGILHTVETLPTHLRQSLSSRIKVMSQLNIAERRLPQDGRTSVSVRGRDVDLRVSTMPTIYGESVVLRILDRTSVPLDFDALGFKGAGIGKFLGALAEPNGLILVTGPTGSGKTTTLYTALARLNDTSKKLFTVEDPIEYQRPGVNQIQVNSRVGLTFATALRSMLRQDPDIVMVGEIRDVETAEIAIQASLTGHLVLSTLHTNSAAATITRLLNMGVESYLLASSLKGVLAQRLVRQLCTDCSIEDDDVRRIVDRLWQSLTDSVHGSPDSGSIVKRAVGCAKCRGTGFRGRTTIYEYLPVSGPMTTAILERRSERDLATVANAEGMTGMLVCGLDKVRQGLTTLDEVLSVTRSDDGAL